MKIGIYKIENLINHKKYIGQSVHIERRFQEHCQPSTNSLISKAIKEFGKENFSFEIIEECKVEELNQKERYYINFYNSLVPNGYNVTDYSEDRPQLYLNYDKETFYKIIEDIKNSQLSFQEISEKYGLDLSMIYYLNRGDYHTLDNEVYPLREVKSFKKVHNYCVDCGKEIYIYAKRCPECSHKNQRKVERPTRDCLKDMIRTLSFESIGRLYGVSGNAIKKWCKSFNLPNTKDAIKKITDEDWKKI